MFARPYIVILTILVLIFTFQNCDGGGGVSEVTVDTSSVGIPQGGPAPGPSPSPVAAPAPSPAPAPLPAPLPGGVGANPLPAGLKAAFRPGTILTVGINQFPLDLTMSAPAAIEVDVSSNDSAYLTDSTMAVPNDDYVPFANQAVTFAAGATTAGVSVTVLRFTGKAYSFRFANCRYGGVPISCLYLF